MIIRVSIKRQVLTVATVLVVILAAGLCTGYFINKQSNKTSGSQSPERLRTLLIQNNIFLDSIKFIDIASPTSAEQHKTIYDKLLQNIKDIEDTSKPTDPELEKDLIDIMAAEKSLLEAYGKQTNNFYKLLSYNPIDDIGTPKLASDETELKQRAAAAQNGIASALQNAVSDNKNGVLSGKAKLSDPAIASLQKAQTCFKELSEAMTDKTVCIYQYDLARRDINQSLIATFDTDSIKNLKDQLREVVSKLSSST